MEIVRGRAITQEEHTVLRGHAKTGLDLVGFPSDAPPDAIIYAIYRYVENWQSRRHRAQYSHLLRSGPGADATAIGLGVVWGDQVVRTLGWEWMFLQHTFAVVAPEQKWAVHPTDFIRRLLYAGSWGCDENTVLELYNRLKAGDLPPYSPQQYEIFS